MLKCLKVKLASKLRPYLFILLLFLTSRGCKMQPLILVLFCNVKDKRGLLYDKGACLENISFAATVISELTLFASFFLWSKPVWK